MIDRRVARTRALLHDAHLRLIRQRGYDAVTVEDICEAANVGRSTFYAHYANKEDLHRGGIETLRAALMERRAAVEADAGRRGWLGFSLPMFEHARDHLDLYQALAGSRGGSVALESVRQMLRDLVVAELPQGRDRGVPREFVVQYLVGAYMAVLTWWLDNGAKASAEEMDAMFRRLANEGCSDPIPAAATL